MPDFKVKSYIGSLHTPEVYERYKAAGASRLVLSIITGGVPLFFLDLDIPKFPRGQRGNNNSAESQFQFVSDTIREWESQGFLARTTEEKAKVVLPLSVADRWSHEKEVLKYRLGDLLLLDNNYVITCGYSFRLFPDY